MDAHGLPTLAPDNVCGSAFCISGSLTVPSDMHWRGGHPPLDEARECVQCAQLPSHARAPCDIRYEMWRHPSFSFRCQACAHQGLKSNVCLRSLSVFRGEGGPRWRRELEGRKRAPEGEGHSPLTAREIVFSPTQRAKKTMPRGASNTFRRAKHLWTKPNWRERVMGRRPLAMKQSNEPAFRRQPASREFPIHLATPTPPSGPDATRGHVGGTPQRPWTHVRAESRTASARPTD